MMELKVRELENFLNSVLKNSGAFSSRKDLTIKIVDESNVNTFSDTELEELKFKYYNEGFIDGRDQYRGERENFIV